MYYVTFGQMSTTKIPTDYPSLMTAYSHPHDQNPLPLCHLGDFGVGFLNIPQKGANRFRLCLAARGPEIFPQFCE